MAALCRRGDGALAVRAVGALPANVRLIPMLPRYRVRQTIAVNFLRTRERAPHLLALLALCRTSKAELA